MHSTRSWLFKMILSIQEALHEMFHHQQRGTWTLPEPPISRTHQARATTRPYLPDPRCSRNTLCGFALSHLLPPMLHTHSHACLNTLCWKTAPTQFQALMKPVVSTAFSLNPNDYVYHSLFSDSTVFPPLLSMRALGSGSLPIHLCILPCVHFINTPLEYGEKKKALRENTEQRQKCAERRPGLQGTRTLLLLFA